MDFDIKHFIKNNYTEYLGDESFLQPMTHRNTLLWKKCKKLLKKEQNAGGVLDIDTKHFSGINNFKPGYVDKKLELIVGFQTDKPLKRIVNPYGGLRMVEQSLKAYGYKLDKKLKENFVKYRKTHNEAVFDAYTPDIKKARHNKLLTGLPDAYGRGRIIGDYRTVALYGTQYLIKQKQKELNSELLSCYTAEGIKLREEVAEQIKALKAMTEMAKSYNCDISHPALTAQEALQAIYFAYLAGAKENNGAATSLGRVSTFIDIYIEMDLRNGILKSEAEAQELIDQFVMKLRFIRHLRTPEYNELFAGDPTWVTESIGGMNSDGRSFVTKTSYRFLHSLINLGASPEPNLTVLWDENLPEPFKKYCAKISKETHAIQFENDRLMRTLAGNDYGIACCVSCMNIGVQMQYFGARCNLAKVLLYAINGGVDERTGELVIPHIPTLVSKEYLDFDEVMENFKTALNYTMDIYLQANNIIHYMHDKYAYEASQMALHNTHVERLMAFGLSGFSVLVDSLSAIKYGKVKPVWNNKIAVDFINEKKYPAYGNDIEEVDSIATAIVDRISNILNSFRGKTYRNAKPTLSILTITSNVVYGKNTGATPDGRKAWTPFAPGANPLHGRDIQGALASLNSVSKIPYLETCEDGISNTFSISPTALGVNEEMQVNNLICILDTYFAEGGHHLNVNVLNRESLLDAVEHPEDYPTLTVRISGYAVLFNSLTKEQKLEIISRTFHEEI